MKYDDACCGQSEWWVKVGCVKTAVAWQPAALVMLFDWSLLCASAQVGVAVCERLMDGVVNHPSAADHTKQEKGCEQRRESE
jgi:hypothetical protein